MKSRKIRCIRSIDNGLNVWKFTEGKTYTLRGRWETDPHVVDDEGVNLWLCKYGNKIMGAGVDEFEFVEAP